MSKNYVLTVWTDELEDEQFEEQLTDEILDCLSEELGVRSTYAAADLLSDDDFYFNAASLDNAYDAWNVGEFGMWIDEDEHTEEEVREVFENVVPTLSDVIIHTECKVE